MCRGQHCPWCIRLLTCVGFHQSVAANVSQQKATTQVSQQHHVNMLSTSMQVPCCSRPCCRLPCCRPPCCLNPPHQTIATAWLGLKPTCFEYRLLSCHACTTVTATTWHMSWSLCPLWCALQWAPSWAPSGNSWMLLGTSKRPAKPSLTIRYGRFSSCPFLEEKEQIMKKQC